MRQRITALILSAGLVLASPTVFSVHDDLLAYPQYQVVFSDSYLSDYEALSLLDPKLSTEHGDSTSLQHQSGDTQQAGRIADDGIPKKLTYERMFLQDQEYLCSIPVVEIAPRNETSEAEARAEEQKEVARATDRGSQLLQELGGGDCLYFISGWWSYSFCYNSEITQFHQLPPQPGKAPFPPVRDPATPKYTLGRVRPKHEEKDNEWDNELEVHKETPQTELQTKGDSKYLVQKLDYGTTCDLTGKPRRIEIQYHCSPTSTDKIGYIKEITTCSYLMVIYTPRLCQDIAFLPPKEVKANVIECRMVLAEDEVPYWESLKALEMELSMKGAEASTPVLNVGGIIVGGGKHISKDGDKLPLPPNWNTGAQGPVTDVIAQSRGKSDDNKVEYRSDEALRSIDLDPEVIEQLKSELQKMAGDKGWRLEVVDVPGEQREIRGIVDSDNEEESMFRDDDQEEEEEGREETAENEGSEETYTEDL